VCGGVCGADDIVDLTEKMADQQIHSYDLDQSSNKRNSTDGEPSKSGTRRYKRSAISMMNDAKVVYNDVHGNENQQQQQQQHVPRDCDISSVMSRPVAPASIAGGGVKWRDQGYLRNMETASVVTSYETNYQTTQSLRRKLDRAMTTLVRIRAERDHIKQEYKIIMSERDNVHKDIEQLQDQVHDVFTSLQLEQQKSSNYQEKIEQLNDQMSVRNTQPRKIDEGMDLHNHLLEISTLKSQLLQTEKERDSAIQAAFDRSTSTSPTHSIHNHNANNNNNSSYNSQNQLIVQSSEGDVSGADAQIPLKSNVYNENLENTGGFHTNLHPNSQNSASQKVHGGLVYYILCCLKD